jgi:hypothetical protein
MMKYTWLLIPTLLFTLSCNLNESGVNEVVIDVDDDFKLTFRENLRTPEDDLIFYLESIENRECEADTLFMRVDNFVTALRVDIDVVNSNSDCLPGLSPARTQAESSKIRDGKTALSIHLEDLVDNNGNIFNDDQGFRVQMETTHGFYLSYEYLRRVPASSLWGYVGFTPTFRQEAQNFLDRLHTLTGSIEVEEGEYGYFSVNKDQEVRVDGQEDIIMYAQPFLRSFRLANKRDIRSLFEEYQEKYPTMRFTFFDSSGDRFE